jgi:SpoVK/Ycf46/Vps4 family AAA+-type ATPase
MLQVNKEPNFLIIQGYVMQGRFHHILHVPPPTYEDLQKILQHYAVKYNLNPETVAEIERKLGDQYQKGPRSLANTDTVLSGAVVENYCKEAVLSSLRKVVAAQHEQVTRNGV